jgi:DNA-binding cell septation regulator SpoVG
MNTTKAKKSGAKEVSTEREYLEIRSHEVSNVRVIEGKNGDVVFFTLKVNGLTIYNCRVATGKNGDFISLPQYKGKNGTYYNVVYAAFSDEDSKKILEEIQAAIDVE